MWNKRDRIRRDTIIGKHENGCICEVFMILKALWVKRLTEYA